MSEPHHPEVAHEPAFGGIARCADCTWRQTFNEDLHELAEGVLLDWHAANPGHTVDHLSADGLAAGMAIPDYVRWATTEFGHLALADTRTGRFYSGYNHEWLAIYESVADTGGLDQAVRANSRRLGITRSQDLGDIVYIATSFYRVRPPRPRNRRLRWRTPDQPAAVNPGFTAAAAPPVTMTSAPRARDHG